jgi:hypothetical protein
MTELANTQTTCVPSNASTVDAPWVYVDMDDAAFRTSFDQFSSNAVPTLEWIGMKGGHALTMKHLVGFLCATDQYVLMHTCRNWHAALVHSPAATCAKQKRVMERIKTQEREQTAAPLWSDPRCTCSWFVHLCRPYDSIREGTAVFRSPIFTVTVITVTGRRVLYYFASADAQRAVLPQITTAMMYELIRRDHWYYRSRSPSYRRPFPFDFFLHVYTRILHHLDASLASYVPSTSVPGVRMEMTYGYSRQFNCQRANQSFDALESRNPCDIMYPFDIDVVGDIRYPFDIADVVQPPDRVVNTMKREAAIFNPGAMKHLSTQPRYRLLQHGGDRVYCVTEPPR